MDGLGRTQCRTKGLTAVGLMWAVRPSTNAMAGAVGGCDRLRPNFMTVTLRLAAVLAWTAALSGQSPDLTGVWSCNDGGTYYLRQVGAELWWYGRSGDGGASFTNVFHGALQQAGVTGRWSDLPPGNARGVGELALRIDSPNRMTAVRKSGGFGGDVWTRPGGAVSQNAPPGGGISPNEPLLGNWGCQDRVYTFTAEGGEIVGRWAVVDRTSVSHSRPSGEIGYRLKPAGGGRYEGQTFWRNAGGQSGWKATTVVVNGDRLSNSGGDFCSTTLARLTGSAGVGPAPAGVNLSGTWNDSGRGGNFTVRQEGGNLTFYGPQGWPTGTGRFTGANTFTMTWPGMGSYDGTVQSDGRVNWNNGVVWARGGPGGVISGAAPIVSTPGPAGVNLAGTWNDSGRGGNFTVRQEGGNLTFDGPQGWSTGTGRFTGPNTFSMTWPGRGSYEGTVGSDGRITWNNGVIWARGGPGGIFAGGTAAGSSGGPCADPRTQAVMDEWLGRAVPPQPAGSALRYEAWGRMVGRSNSANVTVNGPPDTSLSRCEWLLRQAGTLRSVNGLGTLRQYLAGNIQGVVF